MKAKILIIVLILVILLFVSCNTKKKTGSSIVNESKIDKSRSLSSNINLEKKLRVEIDNDGMFLDNKISMKVDTNEDVYILDINRCKIFILSKEGQLKKTLGKKGEGPGEFKNPCDFILTKNRLMVFEFIPSVVHIFNKINSQFLKKKEFSLINQGAIVSSKSIAKNRKVLLRISNLSLRPKSEIIESVILFNQNLTESLLIHKSPKYSLYNTEMIGVSYCGSNDEFYYIASRSKKKYQIFVYNSEGKFSHIINKNNYIPIKKSTNQLKVLEEKIKKRREKGLHNKYIKHDYKTSVKQMVTDNKNRIWVLTPSENPEEEFFKIDIFTNKRIFLNSIILKEFKEPELVLSNEHLYILEHYERKNSNRFYVKYSIKEKK